MPFADRLVVVRGGGDLATGAAHLLHRVGFPVVVLELPAPLAIRRTVAFAAAVADGEVVVDAADPVRGRLVDTADAAAELARDGAVAVLVSPDLPEFDESISIVVDARLAKRNLGTHIDDAPLVVGLGPGFTAGQDCDVVVETKRGHRLGRTIWRGAAEPNTGIPGPVGGATAERVIRATTDGMVAWTVTIGDVVEAGVTLGTVGGATVAAPIDGVVRGLIAPGFAASTGLKIADIDPRADRAACFEISDKARLVGAGVLDAILTWLQR